MSKRTFSVDREERFIKNNEITSRELKANAFVSGLCIISLIVFLIPKWIYATVNTEGMNPCLYSDFDTWWSFWFESLFILSILIVSIFFLVILLPKKNKKYRWFCMLLFAVSMSFMIKYLANEGMDIPESPYIPIWPIFVIIVLWLFVVVLIAGIVMIIKSQQESKKER
jgi:hypothetical protein